ncbi:MAG: hypothetical protein ACXADY_15905 [Candidatus Hodarchaeales archaeon]
MKNNEIKKVIDYQRRRKRTDDLREILRFLKFEGIVCVKRSVSE